MDCVANRFYLAAKEHLLSTEYRSELQWYESRDLGAITREDVVREAAWVILCSGFRESTVRSLFSYLSLCFFDWRSTLEIVTNSESCKKLAYLRFRHEGKLDAIIDVARIVSCGCFEDFRNALSNNPIQTLSQLPYIGKITCYHLAKNLGLQVAKPDRHLTRLASKFGFSDAQQLCNAVAKASGDPLHIVDSVLWRSCVVGLDTK